MQPVLERIMYYVAASLINTVANVLFIVSLLVNTLYNKVSLVYIS